MKKTLLPVGYNYDTKTSSRVQRRIRGGWKLLYCYSGEVNYMLESSTAISKS